jgi:Na+-driven multidrug efflux pump
MDTLTKLAVAKEKRSQSFWLTVVGVWMVCLPFTWITPGEGGIFEGIIMFFGVVNIISGMIEGHKASNEIHGIINAG